MISVKAVKIQLDEVQFRVELHDENLRGGGDLYKAPNGVLIESCQFREWHPKMRLLCICGSHKDKDSRIVTCTSDEWSGIIEAVEAYNYRRSWVSLPPTENPKATRAAADGKTRFELLPLHVLQEVAEVLQHGADKYGEWNWHDDPIRCTTYIGSTCRHLFAWALGEDLDPDSGKHHLVHAIAGLMIVLDARANEKLIDDRRKHGQA
jgi:hypothetical protein